MRLQEGSMRQEAGVCILDLGRIMHKRAITVSNLHTSLESQNEKNKKIVFGDFGQFY